MTNVMGQLPPVRFDLPLCGPSTAHLRLGGRAIALRCTACSCDARPTGATAMQPADTADFGHVFTIAADDLAAFSSGTAGFRRSEFMRGAFRVGGFPAQTCDLALLVTVHRCKPANASSPSHLCHFCTPQSIHCAERRSAPHVVSESRFSTKARTTCILFLRWVRRGRCVCRRQHTWRAMRHRHETYRSN